MPNPFCWPYVMFVKCTLPPAIIRLASEVFIVCIVGRHYPIGSIWRQANDMSLYLRTMLACQDSLVGLRDPFGNIVKWL